MSTSINKEDLILMGGLPRSGNTLLSALLNQNDSIFVTTTSPFLNVLHSARNVWLDDCPVETSVASVSKLEGVVLKSIQEAYHSGLTDREYVIDKRRQWSKPLNIELYIELFGHRPKILCPVRSVTEILSSYNSLFKKNNITLDIKNDLTDNSFLGSYLELKEGYESEYRDCFHFIEFDDLLQDTQNTLDKVYDYLGIERFTHDLNNIKALEEEGDYGMAGLHTLKPKLEPNNSRKDTEEAFEKFVGWEFWR